MGDLMTAGTLARRTVAAHTFRCSNRTYAHLTWTIAELARRYPKARLLIIQTCYNTTIAASAGTHDYDGVFDVEIEGMTWWAAQRFLRSCGWAAWFRHTGSWSDPGDWHIHMCSIPEGLPGNPTPDQIDAAFERVGIRVGVYVPGQIDDYYAHALGLKGQHRAGADRSWFPDNINATVYRYQEDDLMAFSEWSDAEKQAFGDFIERRIRATLIEVDTDADGKTAETRLGAIVRDLVNDVNAIKKKIGA